MSLVQMILYQKAPVFVQNVLISTYGYWWKSRRFGGIFDQELLNYKARESFSAEQWREFQSVELRKLLVHSFETVPFYNALYKKAGFTLDSFRKFELEDLSKLPALSKENLRKYGTSNLLSFKHERNGRFFASSGSTGTPTRILFSDTMHQRWSAAFEARIRNWAGLSRYDSRGMIGGRRIVPEGISRPPYYRYNSAEKQIYFSAYHISPGTAVDYAFALNKYKPAYMTGYAVSNYILANFIKEQNIEVPKLRAVITSSEKLTLEMRSLFQDVYKCKTYDSYSGVEACGLISETEYGQLLVSPDVGIMEILNEDGTPCKPGETGEVYSTGFLNYDQPLIRYRIGDRVKIAVDQNTACGRNMLVIEEIVGRTEDVITGPDGRKMVRFHGIFVNIPKIIKGQIIQYTISDFEIRLVCSHPLDLTERKEIHSRMTSQLGQVNVEITEVQEIPRTANGKFRAVISHLPRQ